MASGVEMAAYTIFKKKKMTENVGFMFWNSEFEF